MQEREAKFPNFMLVDKTINPHPKARITIMVHKEVKYKHVDQYEDTENPMATIMIK